MTATTRKPKQTAANNATLARVKKMMNAKVYAVVLEAYNAGGRDEARETLSLYFNEEESGRSALASIFDGE